MHLETDILYIWKNCFIRIITSNFLLNMQRLDCSEPLSILKARGGHVVETGSRAFGLKANSMHIPGIHFPTPKLVSRLVLGLVGWPWANTATMPIILELGSISQILPKKIHMYVPFTFLVLLLNY